MFHQNPSSVAPNNIVSLFRTRKIPSSNVPRLTSADKSNIKNGDQLISCLKILKESERNRFITEFQDDLKKLLSTGIQLKEALSLLPLIARINLINALGQDVNDLFESFEQYMICLNLIYMSDRRQFIGMTVKSIEKFVSSTDQILQLTKALNEPAERQLIKALKNPLKKIKINSFSNVTVLAKPISILLTTRLKLNPKPADISFIKYFHIKNRSRIIKALSDDTAAFVKTGARFSDCLRLLPMNDRIPFITRMGDSIRSIDFTINQLGSCLTGLHRKDRTKLLEQLGADKLGHILTTFIELRTCFRSLTRKDRLPVMKLLGIEKMSSLVTNWDQFFYCANRSHLSNQKEAQAFLDPIALRIKAAKNESVKGGSTSALALKFGIKETDTNAKPSPVADPSAEESSLDQSGTELSDFASESNSEQTEKETYKKKLW